VTRVGRISPYWAIFRVLGGFFCKLSRPNCWSILAKKVAKHLPKKGIGLLLKSSSQNFLQIFFNQFYFQACPVISIANY
jgi:hypothetical protein